MRVRAFFASVPPRVFEQPLSFGRRRLRTASRSVTLAAGEPTGSANGHSAEPERGGEMNTETAGFGAEVLDGLSRTRKRIASKFFYDSRGVALFNRICALDEYYLTRSEMSLLRQHRGAIAALAGTDACLVEFGSGSSEKARTLLAAFENPAAYVPVDLSASQLSDSARTVETGFPAIKVTPVQADFTRQFRLPDHGLPRNRVGFFPGSTIGNFSHAQAREFLAQAARILGPNAGFIIGVDLEKDERVLIAAYNDSARVTAEFNLNLLVRINRELEADFDLEAFSHLAIYNRDDARIEMYLVSRRRQTVRVSGVPINFEEGERVHTENSHKYSLDRFHALARSAGWTPLRSWVDADELFGIHFLKAA